MLAADQRLRTSDDFATVIRRGRRAARDGLVVHRYAGDPPAAAVRAGFVVPRTVGNAVTRNRLRRRLRHLLRDELLHVPPGTDIVVRALPGVAERSYDELGRHLRAALVAAGQPRGERGRRGDG